ncbi:MAG: hypothetical protein FWF06_00750 [Symbiobacteriaceae bacterium]|nr:hypothetical protein [Symbiobacteriaceae bacterium]
MNPRNRSSIFDRPQGQTFAEDCDMLFFCEKNAQTYRLCYGGAPLNSKRCTPSEKNSMLMLSEMVHRLQMIDNAVKRWDAEWLAAHQSDEAAATVPSEETPPRFDQSQAASLLSPLPTPPDLTAQVAQGRETPPSDSPSPRQPSRPSARRNP